MRLPTLEELEIRTLGECTNPSPMRDVRFVDESNRVLVSAELARLRPYFDACETIPSFERAGPRSKVCFRPSETKAALVTCGGLCPGLNDVIRAVTLTLRYMYGVQDVIGYRYGYAGLGPDALPPMVLDHAAVQEIHNDGGTVLGSSRGPQEPSVMVDTLVEHGVDILFAVGGDGTLRGASAIADEVARRGLSIAVIGIPKTIDNDLQWTERSFGFETAVAQAQVALAGAHAEARGAPNGVGLVKLMGRHSGFIAAHASLANSDVNFCLVPEVPFDLHGEHGFLSAVRARLKSRGHAVVVVAEGAGQEMLKQEGPVKRDASGNLKLADIGTFLRDAITADLRDQKMDFTVKYIDPSYIIRSVPANPTDSEYCVVLGQHAVHAAMAGRTDIVVGCWNQSFVHVPIALATESRKQIDPEGSLWRSVLQATGQPAHFGGDELTRAG